MTHRDWRKAGRYQPDPGAVIVPPEELRLDRWIPPAERSRQKAAQAAGSDELQRRSDRARYKAMVQKFGPREAIRLGVPRDFVLTYLERVERARPKPR